VPSASYAMNLPAVARNAAWAEGGRGGRVLPYYRANIIDMFLKGSDLSSFFGVCPGTYFLCPVSKVCPSSSNRIRGTTTP